MLIETAKSIQLEDGESRKPVASLLTKGKTRTHIVIEDDCYVVYMENPAGRSSRSPWIPAEAWHALKGLPSPKLKSNIKESQLTVAVRAVQQAEFDSPEWEVAVDSVLSLMPFGLREELTNVVSNGPLWAGDSIGKAQIKMLLELGFIQEAVCKGEQGFSGATRLGYSVYKRGLETAAA